MVAGWKEGFPLDAGERRLGSCLAVQVTPGQADSLRPGAEPFSRPEMGELALRVLQAGICGTDGETAHGPHGAAPPGDDHLAPGHESPCEVQAVGEGVQGFAPGDLVVPVVRRACPELCAPYSHGPWDMCPTGHHAGSPTVRLAASTGARYLDDSETPLDRATDGAAFDLVLEASGYAPPDFRASRRPGRNGLMVRTGVSADHHTIRPARQHCEAAAQGLLAWRTAMPGLAVRLIISRHPLVGFQDALTRDADGINSVVEVGVA